MKNMINDEFYTIDYELNDKIVGKDYPQVSCLNTNIIGKFSSWELYKNNPLIKFELQKRSKLTDVLSNIELTTGFLISKKVKEIFDQFHLMRHQYFNATIETKEGLFEYFWLHLTEPDLTKKIDYKKSVFYETEYTFKKEKISLDSFEHYQKLKSKDKDASFGVKLDKITFSDSFDKTLDIFTFLPFDNQIYISKKLKIKLEENNINSFKIEEATNFF
jgi:hypothetical protein